MTNTKHKEIFSNPHGKILVFTLFFFSHVESLQGNWGAGEDVGL